MRILVLAGLLVWPSAPAGAVVLDFEAYSEGTPITDHLLPEGISITVVNNASGLGHPDAVIVFDSACPDGCSGKDSDLRTPGSGVGNDVAQNNVLIIATDLVDSAPADGAVDDPDDEQHGGSIRFFFDPPRRVSSMRVIDVDTYEQSGFVQMALEQGGFEARFLLPWGDNSAQTITFAEAPFATSLRIFLGGSGAVDDIVLDETPTTSSTTSLPSNTSTTVLATTTSTVAVTSTSLSSGTTTTLPASSTLPTTTTPLTSTTIVSTVCGDANGDGWVTASDAIYVLHGAINASFLCPVAACDVDASGVIEATDALATLRLAVGLSGNVTCSRWRRT